MNTLKSRLRDFKLSGIYNSLEDRISYANEKSLSHIELLELLFEDEVNNRKSNSYKKRYSKARLPSHKTLEDESMLFLVEIDKIPRIDHTYISGVARHTLTPTSSLVGHITACFS